MILGQLLHMYRSRHEVQALTRLLNAIIVLHISRRSGLAPQTSPRIKSQLLHTTWHKMTRTFSSIH